MVMFLRGRVTTQDGSPVPHDALVERVCNARVRQQVHPSSQGDFSMELGSMTDSFVDASGDGPSQSSRNRSASGPGIPRQELMNCEIRAQISGFRSRVVNLVALTPTASSIDVGPIFVERSIKPKGMTLSAKPYKAPNDARKSYEKGVSAETKGNLADARQYFEKAVDIYPTYVDAWFQLGTVLKKLDQKESARTAYTQATTIDSKFLPPYLALAAMSYDAKNWTEVLNLTNHVLDLDPLKYGDITGYILDLDPMDYAEAFFYNAAANYKLNNLDAAEKSGLKAARLDLRPRFPQLHLLLAEIFARKNNYADAISEAQTYLELAPQAKDADRVRERITQLAELNVSSAGQKSDQN
jgi:tetratricopeptide (TPR) repeat protein